jgi:hypothetical protein
MKQKIIYLVLLVTAMYLPASSKECAKVFKCVGTESVIQVPKKTSFEINEEAALPVSPFNRLLFNL